MVRDSDELSNGSTWVVVADAGCAEIYSRSKRFGALELVRSFEEPDARSKESELSETAPGRTFDRGGQGRHAMEPAHSEKEQLLESFAHGISEFVESARLNSRFDGLVLIAGPKMLGQLRRQLSSATRRAVILEIDKHMTGRGAAAVAELIDSERE